MLHDFLAEHRDELATRCRSKVALRTPLASHAGQEFGVPLFIGELIETLRAEQASCGSGKVTAIGGTASKHGHELLRRGFSVDQVIHDYGDLCQALTELAYETKTAISVDEFHTFNRCLDSAIADAVTEFSRARDHDISEAAHKTMNERLGFLAHELRNHLYAASLAFGAIKAGTVALSGATGGVLERSLRGLQNLVDRSLADVRLTAGLQPRRERVSVDELVHEARTLFDLEAGTRKLQFSSASEAGLDIDVDREMIASAIANLLQNAMKFTRAGGRIRITARAEAERVLIDVADECGGLPAGGAERLFRPFEQQSADRTGLGLGLSISRRSVEINDGKLDVRDIPGTGCVFTIDLPRAAGA